MKKQERIQKILELLGKKSSLTTNEIIEELNMSPSTVRSDIREIHTRNLAQRYHGCLVPLSTESDYLSLEFRSNWNISVKKTLAKKLLDSLPYTNMIFLDESISALCVAQEIKARNLSMTIVTNSLLIMQELSKENNINIISLGGYLMNEQQAFVGKELERAFTNYNIPIGIIGAGGLCAKGTLESFPPIFDVKKVIVKYVDQVYLIADSFKFSHSGGQLCVLWSEIDVFCSNYDPCLIDFDLENFRGKII